jgi:hypothetical protein
MTNLTWWLVLCLSLVSQVSLAQEAAKDPSPSTAFVAPRELLVLKTGVDQVWGQWMVAVINRTEKPVDLSFKAHLPKEVTDFQAVEGLEAKDVVLDDDGVSISKSFAPGVQVVSVSFVVPALSGSAKLSINTDRAVPEFVVMTPTGLLSLESDQIKRDGEDSQQGERYSVFGLREPLSSKQTLSLQVTGVPEGRKKLWMIGGVMAFVLVSAAVLLGIRSRPHVV